jgi:hypothetical protein
MLIGSGDFCRLSLAKENCKGSGLAVKLAPWQLALKAQAAASRFQL